MYMMGGLVMNDRIKRLADRALIINKKNNFDYDKCKKIFDDETISSYILKEGLCTKFYLSNSNQSITDDELLIGFTYQNCPCKNKCNAKVNEIIGKTTPVPQSYYNLKDSLWIIGGNHKTANFEKVLKIGLQGYIKLIEESQDKYKADNEKQELLSAMTFAIEGIEGYAKQCADICRKLAEKAYAQRKEELLALARICDRVPMKPAENFYEAVQAYWFVFSLFPDGLGRLDQYLYPYYKKDIENGEITRDFALELIEELFIKVFSILGSEITWSGNNHMVISGYIKDGGDGYNDVTDIILQAIEELPTWRPQVTFRKTRYTTHDQLKHVIAANRNRPDLIMFINDDIMIGGIIEHLRIPYEDAINYSLSGCSEMVITGQSQMGSLEGHINIVKALENSLEKNAQYECFDDFYKAYEKNLKKDVDTIITLSELWDNNRKMYLDILASIFTDGCIESGTSLSAGGAKYNGCTWIANGLINVADSLSVIKQFVFEENRFSLVELCEMLSVNWANFESVRQEILERGHFFGNDDDYIDELPEKIIDSLNSFVKDRVPIRGGKYTFGTLSGYELAHIIFGKSTGATPDGRYSGDEFSPSISISMDRCKSGITAYFKSISKIDYKKMPNAVVVNVTLDKNMVNTENKLEKLTYLLDTYFQLGGVQLQINYISSKELEKAQETPDKYRNLRVRVTGFSGYFTTFDTDLQNELIRRAIYHD